MLAVICLSLLMLILVIICFLLFSNNTISKRCGKTLYLVIAVLFAGFSFFFSPQDFIRWDLLEHFKVINEMRSGGIEYATKGSQYADLFVYNYFAYFISLLPKCLQNLVSTIPLIIDFSIVGYIYKRIYNVHIVEANGKTRVLSVLLWFCTFGIKLAITDIRCSLAVSLVAVAIYLFVIEKRKKIFAILLSIIAVFVHQFAVVVIVVGIFSKIKKPGVLLISSLSIAIFLHPLARFIVNNTSNAYINFSFNRILKTENYYGFIEAIKNFSTSQLLVDLGFIMMSICLYYMSLKAKCGIGENNYCKNVINFTNAVGAVAIGLAFNYLYLERFMYLVSFAFLLVVPIYNCGYKMIRNLNLLMLPIAIYVLYFNDIYILMVNYLGYYFLAI